MSGGFAAQDPPGMSDTNQPPCVSTRFRSPGLVSPGTVEPDANAWRLMVWTGRAAEPLKFAFPDGAWERDFAQHVGHRSAAVH